MSNYIVNTGTGEKQKVDNTSYFTCVFSNDMSICYEMIGDELKKDHYNNSNVTKGVYGYKETGCYEYRYLKTENGVKIYKKEGSYYKYASQSKIEWYYAGGTEWKYRGGEWSYSGLEKKIEYIYFSTDYSKMNQPGGIIVRTYDRIITDDLGKPTQIW